MHRHSFPCYVSHTDVPCKNGWTDRDAIWVLTRVGPRNHVLDGVEIPYEKGQFAGCPAHWKELGISAALYAAKGSFTGEINIPCNRREYTQLFFNTRSSFVSMLFLGLIAWKQCIRCGLLLLNVAHGVVYLSVYVSHTDVPCKNGWTDRDAIWGLTRVGPRNHVLDGVEIPCRKGQFFKLSGWLKRIGNLCCAVRSKRIIQAYKAIIQSSITARHAMGPAAFRQNSLTTWTMHVACETDITFEV